MKLDWTKILRFIPEDKRDEVLLTIRRHYMPEVTTNWPIVQDKDGVLRFKEDPMTVWLHSRTNLNDMVSACQHGFAGVWSRKKIKDFYRGMGYSLSGFGEVFTGKDDNWHTRKSETK